MKQEVILSKFGSPSCLTSIEVALLTEPQEILVVGPNVKLPTNNVVSPFREGAHDGEHLTVMNWVISFNLIEGFGIERNRMIDSFLFLQKDSTSGVITGISFNMETSMILGKTENRCIANQIFEYYEGFVTCRGPFELYPLFGEVVKWLSNMGEVRYKMAIKV